jgi:hypothetical protein
MLDRGAYPNVPPECLPDLDRVAQGVVSAVYANARSVFLHIETLGLRKRRNYRQSTEFVLKPGGFVYTNHAANFWADIQWTHPDPNTVDFTVFSKVGKPRKVDFLECWGKGQCEVYWLARKVCVGRYANQWLLNGGHKLGLQWPLLTELQAAVRDFGEHLDT